MLVSKTSKLKWSNKIKKIYVDKGYVYTGLCDEFEVKVEDLGKGSNALVDVQCDYCGETVPKHFSAYNKQREKIDTNKDCCLNCAPIKLKESFIQKYGVDHPSQVPEILEKIKQGERIDFSLVQEAFKRVGYELISASEEYESGHTPLNYICPHHRHEGIKTMSYNNLRHGRSCKSCATDKVSEILRYSGEFICSEFIKKGYEPLFKAEEYINARIALPYICKNHREEGRKTISYNSIQSGHGCHSCFADRNTGEKSYKWNPNLTDEERLMKRSYTEYYSWRKDVFKRDDYTCQCCGQRGGKLNAHHLVNYSHDVVGRLDLENSATMCKEHHILFHKTYGYQNNTREQYEEFKESLTIQI